MHYGAMIAASPADREPPKGGMPKDGHAASPPGAQQKLSEIMKIKKKTSYVRLIMIDHN